MTQKINRKSILGVCSVALVVSIISYRNANNTLEYPITYSANAVEHLTGRFEGCRQKSYKDTGNLWTVGIGHLCGNVKPNEDLTIDQIANLFNKDLYIAEQCVLKNFNGNKMNTQQREAMTDFVFNVGCEKASNNIKSKNMTKIRSYALNNDFNRMCNALLAWDKGRDKNGNLVVIKGLKNRRIAENKWCLK